MTHRTGLVLALVRLLLPAPGEAAPTPRPAQASLSVSQKTSAHGCPSEREFKANVAAILGYAPFHKGARRHVSAVLWATGGTFHARIQLLDARTHKTLGNRELSAAGPTCEALSEAMALAIALAIDPLAQPPPPKTPAAASAAPLAPPVPAPPVRSPPAHTSAAPAASAASAVASPHQAVQPLAAPSELPLVSVQVQDAGPAEAVAAVTLLDARVQAADAGTALGAQAASAPVDAGAPEAVVPAAVAQAVESAPPPAAASSSAAPVEGGFHGLVGAGADVTVGLVPSTAFAAVLHGGVAWTFASGELELRWLPSTSTAFGVGTISSTLFTAALVGCATFQSVGAFGVCGLFEVGPFTSQGRGYPQSLKTTTWTVELGVRGQWDWVFAHPVGLRVHVDGLVNVVRTRLLVGPDVAWQAPVVALDVGVGLLLVF